MGSRHGKWRELWHQGLGVPDVTQLKHGQKLAHAITFLPRTKVWEASGVEIPFEKEKAKQKRQFFYKIVYIWDNWENFRRYEFCGGGMWLKGERGLSASPFEFQISTFAFGQFSLQQSPNFVSIWIWSPLSQRRHNFGCSRRCDQVTTAFPAVPKVGVLFFFSLLRTDMLLFLYKARSYGKRKTL